MKKINFLANFHLFYSVYKSFWLCLRVKNSKFFARYQDEIEITSWNYGYWNKWRAREKLFSIKCLRVVFYQGSREIGSFDFGRGSEPKFPSPPNQVGKKSLGVRGKIARGRGKSIGKLREEEERKERKRGPGRENRKEKREKREK